jgi:hypothetical protein
MAAEVLSQIGWSQATFENACFQFIRNPDSVPYPQITPAMRAVAIFQRKGASEALVAKAKAYYASEAFKQRWEEEVGPTAETVKKQSSARSSQKKQAEDSLAQAEQMMAMLPPAQQAELKKNLAKARKDLEKAPEESREITNPKANLKQALQHFLAVTDGIDYAAATTAEAGSKRHFLRPEFESKSWEWKMGYRAGKEATEGLRSSLRAWLAELK